MLSTVLALQIGQAHASGNKFSIDTEAAVGLIQAEKNTDPTIVRSRNVHVVNLDALQETDTFTLNLLRDGSFNAIKERVEKRGTKRYTWFGNLAGVEESQIILTVENGSIAGNITVRGKMYQVRDIGSGVYSIHEIDQSAFSECHPPIPIDTDPIELDVSESAMLDDGATIDIMVVYTAAAAGGGNLAAEIQLAVDETNQSYANSGINPRLNLVHTAQVTYMETGHISTDLNRLQNKTDGFMDNVHTLRDAYGADMVSLWVANGGGYCGVAYLMTTVSTAFAKYAFQVTARFCATGNFSFGHEFGHLQSARHDWYVDSTNNRPYIYNHGYVYPPNRWRTIMAYNTECSDLGFNCTRLQYWSNPDVLYGGQPMGIPEGHYHPADNRKTLNNTAWTVANFRQSVSPISADVKANGSDGPIAIAPSDTLSLTIELDSGGHTNNADWWVLGDTPFGWYYYNLVSGWRPGQNVTYQGALFDLSPYEVMKMTLPEGSYKLYFGVDMDMNGVLDMNRIYYDKVEVEIRE